MTSGSDPQRGGSAAMSDASRAGQEERMQAGEVPFDRQKIDAILESTGFDRDTLSIRETNRLVSLVEQEMGVRFVRMEFGIPNLPCDPVAYEFAHRADTERNASAQYAPFDGIPELKEEAARFVKGFMNLDVTPQCCVPTVGAMHGGFVAQAVAGHRLPGRQTILYLEPSFPVSKRQTRFHGLAPDGVELYDCRGEKLLAEVERKMESGRIGGLLYSSPNNPSWVVLKPEELRGLGELCQRYDVLPIEDLAYFGMDFREDYGRPGEPPFQPTIARYTDRYIILISSSKMFSFAGARIGIAVIAPQLWKSEAAGLQDRFGTTNVGHAFVHGGLYCSTAGVPQASQWGLVGLLKSANEGRLDFVQTVREYGRRAHALREIFLRHGFELVYDNDLGEPLADGFYFTIRYPGFHGRELLMEMICYGISTITLETTGSNRTEGLRVCVSFVGDDELPLVDARLRKFRDDHPSSDT
ncbi:MAG: aminotransferase class I/II-fold pyridoxal phosphate-dependent enzyme [Candidatus Eisenbacteria bacterium]|nr:aminotransferase class I/II-fold pyridoxal phosphate-dependent enzyme [Candidatus Eisenbacteria bacterium]